jgi:putative nucleotidyltransferase with HDIG domain
MAFPSRIASTLLLAAALAGPSISPTPAAAQSNPPSPDDLIPEMELVFSETQGMIDHTKTVLGHAEAIQRVEGGDLVIVRSSAILHDIGIPRAREVHGSSSGEYQEIEGPPIARELLAKHGFTQAQIDHIAGIVANHHSDADPEIVSTLEFHILWDADWLVNFPRRYREATSEEKAAAIDSIFKTGKGKALAREMFLE